MLRFDFSIDILYAFESLRQYDLREHMNMWPNFCYITINRFQVENAFYEGIGNVTYCLEYYTLYCANIVAIPITLLHIKFTQSAVVDCYLLVDIYLVCRRCSGGSMPVRHWVWQHDWFNVYSNKWKNVYPTYHLWPLLNVPPKQIYVERPTVLGCLANLC